MTTDRMPVLVLNPIVRHACSVPEENDNANFEKVEP